MIVLIYQPADPNQDLVRKCLETKYAMLEAKYLLKSNVTDKVLISTIGSKISWVMKKGPKGYGLRGFIRKKKFYTNSHKINIYKD